MSIEITPVFLSTSELWMHLVGWKSAQQSRVALVHSLEQLFYASFMLS